ncbi:MAG TPA: VCBS repeat-containing protein, partial [Acidimicrobiales bacterium]|nr:VCBS repeat-containing protein [Acidimicrobiales bacterium]
MGTAKTGIIGSGAAAAALLLLAGAAPPAGAAPVAPSTVVRTCPAPFVTADPVWSTTPGVPAGNPGVAIDQVPAPARTQTALDMDDDGTVDTTVVGLDGSVTVQRGDGDLVVTGIPSGGTGFSVTGDDLDGDGRSELVVWRRTGIGQGTRSTTWIVPGTTPPGTVAATDVGASFEGGVTGDVTGDGLDDLSVAIPAILVSIPLGYLSGADVVAALPSSSPFAGLDVIALRADLDF